MKEMTSAEFKRANFEELTEPIAIKRYKDVRGYYYPAGQQLSEQPVMAGIAPVIEEAGAYQPLDIADMFRQIAKELREIKADIPCSDPIFHDHG